MRWFVFAFVLLAGCSAGMFDDVPMELQHHHDPVLAEDGESTAEVLTNEETFATGQYQTRASEVKYFGNTNGYFVQPIGEGPFPGVVMIHEWWGLNADIKSMADSLATHGYMVLAVDLFDGQVATSSATARRLVSGIDQARTTDNLRAAANYLESQRASSVGSLGWCFGGGQSLQLAMTEQDVDATVIYYGRLVTDQSSLENVESPVLGIFGSEDEGIPLSDVQAFESSLTSLDVESDIRIYDGVGHAFTNPSGPAFAQQEAVNAWTGTLLFLEKHLE